MLAKWQRCAILTAVNITQQEMMWAAAVGMTVTLVLGVLGGYAWARFRSVRRIAELQAE